MSYKYQIRTFLVFLPLISFFVFTQCKQEKVEKAEVQAVGEVASVSPDAKSYVIDTDRSVVRWAGYKPTYGHNGILKLKSGRLNVKKGVVESGEIVLDMSSIEVVDLKGEQKSELESHLKGTAREGTDDFFNVREYPEARFDLVKTLRIVGANDYNFQVYGNLALKDSVKQVGFKSQIDISEDQIIAKSLTFEINRLRWGIRYQSNSMVDDVTDDFIKDGINLQIDIFADRIKDPMPND